MPLWILYGLLSAVFAALVAIFGKIGISKVDSTLATTIRAIIMALFLFFISLSAGKFSMLNTLQSKPLKYIFLSGIAGAVSWLFYFLALKTGPATAVSALDRLSLVFILVLSSLILGESLTIRSLVAVILIISGAILLVLK
jgi:bacterial/archaeal transporter family protein